MSSGLGEWAPLPVKDHTPTLAYLPPVILGSPALPKGCDQALLLVLPPGV